MPHETYSQEIFVKNSVDANAENPNNPPANVIIGVAPRCDRGPHTGIKTHPRHASPFNDWFLSLSNGIACAAASNSDESGGGKMGHHRMEQFGHALHGRGLLGLFHPATL
jgi:hypothetical protein